MTICKNVCETPVSMSASVSLHLTTLWHYPLQPFQRFSLHPLPSSSIYYFFGFPFPPCSMYLHHSGLLVGLVFPTFPAMWNKTGRETREKCEAVKRGWEEGRGDGCKTGCETQEEGEPRRSLSRETGSSSSRRSLPPQRGLARRYLTYYFTRAYLKSLLHVISQNVFFFFCIQTKVAVEGC